MRKTGFSSRNETYVVGLILCLALVHGLVYVFVIPPWQHYDEPKHFERVWLTAHLGRSPTTKSDYDAEMSRAVVASMIAHKFYAGLGKPPDLSSGQEIHIPGVWQLEEPPLYYWLASLPVRFLGSAGIDTQLYAARMVSLLFYLLTVLSAWGAARELTRSGHPLRWMLPISVALLPAFTDLATAVNNDVAAIGVFSLFFWGSVRLIKRGFSLLTFLCTVLTASLTYFVKNTAMVAFFALPFVLLFALLRGKLRWLSWAFIVVGIVAVLGLSLRWDDAIYWSRAFAQTEPTRLASDKAILGRYVLRLDTWNRATPAWVPPVFQLIPIEVARGLAGKDITLGVWMWASQPIKAKMPPLWVLSQSFSRPVMLSETPAFYALNVKIPAPSGRMWVSLSIGIPVDAHVQVFFDGFVLVEGIWPEATPPEFTSPDGSQGEWGGQPFVNLLRNASVEQAGPRFQPRIDNLAGRFLPNSMRLSMILDSLLDWPSTGELYWITSQHLFNTFWAKFAWGHVALLGSGSSGGPYTALAWISLLGCIGAMLGVIRRWKLVHWEILFFIVLVVLSAWGMALVRRAVGFPDPYPYYPTARHAYPVVIPTLLILCFGWLEWCRWLNSLRGRFVARGGRVGQILSSAKLDQIGFQFILYTIFFVALDVLSIVSILLFYENR